MLMRYRAGNFGWERGVELFMLKVKVKAKPEKLEKRDGNCDVAGTNALAYWGQQH